VDVVYDFQGYMNTGNDYVPMNSYDNTTGDGAITRIDKNGMVYNVWYVRNPNDPGSLAVWSGKPINYVVYYTRKDA
jgi:hypothetical protein